MLNNNDDDDDDDDDNNNNVATFYPTFFIKILCVVQVSHGSWVCCKNSSK